MADSRYRAFNIRLIPEVSDSIGIRIPVLRKYAKELDKQRVTEFIEALPHKYLEENHLHGFIIEQIKDFDTAVSKTDEFLRYIDNWQTCDCFSPPVFAQNRDKLIIHISKWIASEDVYTVRYGICMLMRYYLDESFKPMYLEKVANIKSDEYYVKMMKAWYFATALCKQYEITLPYITERRLDQWTHKKTISKACDSRRIMPEQKLYLKSLR